MRLSSFATPSIHPLAGIFMLHLLLAGFLELLPKRGEMKEIAEAKAFPESTGDWCRPDRFL